MVGAEEKEQEEWTGREEGRGIYEASERTGSASRSFGGATGRALCVRHANRPSSLGRADFGPNRAGGARVPSKIRGQRAQRAGRGPRPSPSLPLRPSLRSTSLPSPGSRLRPSPARLDDPRRPGSPLPAFGGHPSAWSGRKSLLRKEEADVTGLRPEWVHRTLARGARSPSSSRPGRRPSVFWSLSGPCLRPVSVVPGPSRSGLSGHPPDFCAREGSICATGAS